MKKLTKVLCLALCAALCCAAVGPLSLAEASRTSAPNVLTLSVEPYSADMETQAFHYLLEAQAMWGNNPERYGFTEREVAGLELGHPFTIYVFDDDFQVNQCDGLVFSLLSAGNIVGVMEMSRNADNGAYNITVGRSYGDALNNLRIQYVNHERLILGNAGDMLFATDGRSVTILEESVCSEIVTYDEILSRASTIRGAVQSNLVDVTDAIDFAARVSRPQITPTRWGVQLNVPLIGQGSGICAMASWASVLNYRICTNYTAFSLTQTMYSCGFTSGTGIADAPNMEAYRDFAVEHHNLSTTLKMNNYVPTISAVYDTLMSDKPIMGYWTAPNFSDPTKTDAHSTNIIGCTQISSDVIYEIHDPRKPKSQAIFVTNVNVAYSYGGRTWQIKGVLY